MPNKNEKSTWRRDGGHSPGGVIAGAECVGGDNR